jgi:hypothetical protein
LLLLFGVAGAVSKRKNSTAKTNHKFLAGRIPPGRFEYSGDCFAP